MPHTLLHSTIRFAFATVVLGLITALTPAAVPPNVLLVITDDQGYGDVSSHGNDKLATPNQNRIAAEGARFNRFFVSPVCAPTRASLLTGRYHLRTGVHGVTRTFETMRAGETTLAESFAKAGYATACFGKWHNGAHFPHDPNGQGFEEFVGFCAGHWNNYFDPILQHNQRFVRREGFIIDIFTDDAIAWIEKNKAKPFFCFVPFNTPHSPWQVPDTFYEKFEDTDLTPEEKCAYAMVENIDHNLGRLLTKLDDLKIAENTIVLFMTDNGANSDRYNAGMRGRKGSVHEGGSRVPLFIRWHGKIKAGTVIEPICAHIDLFPTLCTLTGVDSQTSPDRPLDGRNLAPILFGKNEPWPERTLFTFRKDGTAKGTARTGQYRAVKDKRWMLFDMLADPGQKKEIALQNPEVLARLQSEYESTLSDVTTLGFDPIPTEIGHREAPDIRLYGHEAFLHPAQGEGIAYGGKNGFANDFIAHWTDTDSYPAWPIKAVRNATYKVEIGYSCGKDSLGTKIALRVGDATAEATITQIHLPNPIPDQNRTGIKEVPDMIWGRLKLPDLTIPKGTYELRLRAVGKPGEQVMNIKYIRLVED